MKIDNGINGPVDQALARRFRQLREAEAVDTPVFPTDQELQLRMSTNTVVRGAWVKTVPKFALAASVLIAVFLYLNPGAEQNPAQLYADVMSANTVATDSLLSLTSTIAPQNTGLPGFFDFNVSFDDSFETN